MATKKLLPHVDVLLVTVTEVEASAVIKEVNNQISQGQIQREPNHNDTWHIPNINNTYHDFGYIGGARTFMVQSGMGSGGPSGSTLTIHEAIKELSPSAVIMVGIAFGVNKYNQNIGEILVSQQLQAYELQRLGTAPNGESSTILRGDCSSASPKLLEKFTASSHKWNKSSVKFGKVLSGDKLVDNQDFRDQLLKLAQESIGGDMEGTGLYASAFRSQVHWILVKAICDWADGQKDVNKDEYQQKAAQNAAEFVIYTLLQGGFDSGKKHKNNSHSNLSSALKEHFKEVTESIRNGRLVFFLGSGINFSNTPNDNLPPNDIQIAEELHESSSFKTKELIGLPCDVCPYKLKDRPDDRKRQTSLCPIKKDLANFPHLQYEQDLVVAKVDIRCLSQYIITDTNASGLMDKLSRYFRRNYSPNKFQYLFASLAASMEKKQYKFPYQLIATTNYDLGLECAFEKAFDGSQTTFDVVSYIAEGDDCSRFKHIFSENGNRKVEVIGRPEQPTNQYEKLPLAENLSNNLPTVERPIILKLFGGALHNSPNPGEDSFAIAPTHLLNYMIGKDGKKPILSELLPQKLIQRLNQSDILFIGFSANDSDLQMLLSRVCPGRFGIAMDTSKSKNGTPKAWLIHQSSPGQLSNKYFSEHKWAVELVECPYEDYVNKLQAHLEKVLNLDLSNCSAHRNYNKR
ncbi:SIR2 family protein [Nostoc sp. FACHB-152]|uniref:5'-methylthioadenosine/S-adenosylhomocysteine nucleosidase family protein n=1 Tax=unclassified Nostoc TaxID=2593658 RepID=UPI0016896096|nr:MULTISPECIES: SIR2 family protein [unclassified Nostoc]MBD2445854.1 SIR2 family protein [Nostoc sp. FACHB-152]MBD2467970.1 SIR2 family protein [Nostoc sp. FACHB-145]